MRGRLGLRWLAFLLGLALMLWLPIEDTNEYGAVFFALAAAAWVVAYRLALSPGQAPPPAWMFTLAGLLAGLAITPLALFFMAFKSGLHGHGLPDYTPAQVTSVLQRTPVWTAAGLLIGLGAALLQKIRSK